MLLLLTASNLVEQNAYIVVHAVTATAAPTAIPYGLLDRGKERCSKSVRWKDATQPAAAVVGVWSLKSDHLASSR